MAGQAGCSRCMRGACERHCRQSMIAACCLSAAFLLPFCCLMCSVQSVWAPGGRREVDEAKGR